MVQCKEVCSYAINEECLKNIVYKYYLMEDIKTIRFNEAAVNLKSYGIKVVKEEILNNSLRVVAEDYVEDISPNVDKVLNLIDFLKDHGVSPVHLLDVIGEIVDEWVGDFDSVVMRKTERAACCH